MHMAIRVIAMHEAGRLTVPEEARRALGLGGAATFELDIDAAGGVLVLRSTGAPPAGDVAFTPEHLESLARGLRDSREGCVRRLTEEDLLGLGRLKDANA
jgi:bifunctional DNA-binding transcriptional regulator/antitoxin component of YhaV-PrlF toxin-antitoxin module